MRVLGKDLRVGDVIEVFWKPRKDTILELTPYEGALKNIFPEGAQIAKFVFVDSMTIENNQTYEVVNRSE
ncbi:hypothetical protein [Ralstonia phage RSP15]|uniref:hypothetical protein n=1 Tax=Ralstonia phage RSP15 TaxID=1785960 RepID=UPI00074D4211|nr:hypothetical protein BH754_gp131 [Ralstonia phage RSP15]BAU40175.1 hypothetical protein [Ralstonia phage RSP15]